MKKKSCYENRNSKWKKYKKKKKYKQTKSKRKQLLVKIPPSSPKNYNVWSSQGTGTINIVFVRMME